MRIGFMGAGGTGKSSVAGLLSKKLDLPLIGSPSRQVFKDFGVLKEDDQLRVTGDERLALQREIFVRINKQVYEHKDGIFERTPLDNFSYLLLRCHDIVEEAEIYRMKITCANSMREFDKVFYFPIFDWKEAGLDDNMRTQSLAARMIIESMILTWVNEQQFVYWMPNIGIEDRVVHMSTIIMSAKQEH